MAQQLKRWESPRRKGRNHKGRGGSAKARQYKKRQKRLLKKLRQGVEGSPNTANKKGQTHEGCPFFCGLDVDQKDARMRGVTPCLIKYAKGRKPPYT